MKYIEFFNRLDRPIFNLHDLSIQGLDILPVQLSQWTKQGYLVKLRNGLYIFASRKNEVIPETIAHYLREPSYISCESALFIHGLIPEIVYNPTSVTTKKTITFQNELGLFIYYSIKKDLFFGYTKINKGHNIYLLADLEKALLDYLYLNSARIEDEDDIEELRFNPFTLEEIDKTKIVAYLKIFDSRKLERICGLIFGKQLYAKLSHDN